MKKYINYEDSGLWTASAVDCCKIHDSSPAMQRVFKSNILFHVACHESCCSTRSNMCGALKGEIYFINTLPQLCIAETKERRHSFSSLYRNFLTSTCIQHFVILLFLTNTCYDIIKKGCVASMRSV